MQVTHWIARDGRLKRAHIDIINVNLLFQGKIKFTNLPEDFKIVDIRDAMNLSFGQGVCMFIHSGMFEPVKLGEPIPEHILSMELIGTATSKGRRKK